LFMLNEQHLMLQKTDIVWEVTHSKNEHRIETNARYFITMFVENEIY
jgi:hypothetical protein